MMEHFPGRSNQEAMLSKGIDVHGVLHGHDRDYTFNTDLENFSPQELADSEETDGKNFVFEILLLVK